MGKRLRCVAVQLGESGLIVLHLQSLSQGKALAATSFNHLSPRDITLALVADAWRHCFSQGVAGAVVAAADDHFCRKPTGAGLGEFRDGAKINNVSGKGDGDVPAYLAKSETGPGGGGQSATVGVSTSHVSVSMSRDNEVMDFFIACPLCVRTPSGGK